MKIQVSRNYILKLIDSEEKNFKKGNWAAPSKEKNRCVGCLVGNTFMSLMDKAPSNDWAGTYFLEEFINKSLKLENGMVKNQYGVACYPSHLADEVFSEVYLLEHLEAKRYNSALSHCFEALYQYGNSSALKDAIIKYFPKHFMLEVDGLKLKDKLPVGVRRIKSRAKTVKLDNIDSNV